MSMLRTYLFVLTGSISLLRGNPQMDQPVLGKELSPIADVEYEGEEDSYGGVLVTL